MNIGIISLIVLVVAIFIGFKRKINTGLVSIAFAFILGFFVMIPGKEEGSMVAMSSAAAKAKLLISGWPTKLFFILLGMTLLFSIARNNKTLELIARRTARLSRGNRKLIPIIFFLLATFLAAIGPGNIAICALLLPIAMAVAAEEEINHLLMAVVTIAGSNAGGLSPIAPTGIIGTNLAEAAGFQDIGMHIFAQMVIAQIILAALCYIVLGGYKLPNAPATQKKVDLSFNKQQRITLFVIVLVVISILLFKWNIGFAAFIGAFILLLLRVGDEKAAIAGVPWSTLILISGVGVLVNVVSKAGGITTLTDFLATFMNDATAAPLMTIIGGLMSAVSSASGVVMPTLIPTVPGLVEKMGVQGDVMITAIILGAHLVTNSPLSTLGALAVASADDSIDKNKFFNELLILGFGGVLFGALLVFIRVIG